MTHPYLEKGDLIRFQSCDVRAWTFSPEYGQVFIAPTVLFGEIGIILNLKKPDNFGEFPAEIEVFTGNQTIIVQGSEMNDIDLVRIDKC